MSKLCTIALSATESKPILVIPEFILFTTATPPTRMTLEVDGDGVIFNLDASGLTSLNGLRLVGELAANTYLFQVANGFINKTGTLTIANATAVAIDVYGWSEGEGNMYHVHGMSSALAGASIDVKDFAYAAFPSAAATDLFTVTWANKKTQQFNRLELAARLAYKQDQASTKYNVDNLQREVSLIQFLPTAAQSVYYTKYALAQGTVNQKM